MLLVALFTVDAPTFIAKRQQDLSEISAPFQWQCAPKQEACADHRHNEEHHLVTRCTAKVVAYPTTHLCSWELLVHVGSICDCSNPHRTGLHPLKLTSTVVSGVRNWNTSTKKPVYLLVKLWISDVEFAPRPNGSAEEHIRTLQNNAVICFATL